MTAKPKLSSTKLLPGGPGRALNYLTRKIWNAAMLVLSMEGKEK